MSVYALQPGKRFLYRLGALGNYIARRDKSSFIDVFFNFRRVHAPAGAANAYKTNPDWIHKYHPLL